ncbi:glycosyltransferase family 4 protein [Sporolactobacillus vineae]|uniref:glycosyltransferase family 4 protein n=1 Tax=Sporolactobacillus vineae TaxID=444463 RepID=UPI00028943BF|nr:glycosyltransferase family 1 protein [Sporolactobacillus vineae]
MKIYINGRFLTQSVTGVQRYAHEVVKSMDDLLDLNKYKSIQAFLIVPENVKQKVCFKNIQFLTAGKLTGHFWEQLELPYFVKSEKLVNLCNAAPIFKKNQIVTIHDAAAFKNYHTFSIIFRLWYQLLLKLECRFSKKIVTVSQFSKNEIMKHTSIKSGKISVFSEGIEHIEERQEDDSILGRNNLNEKPYILAVGSLDPRKNFKTLVKAFLRLNNIDVNIVIAGGTNPRIFKDEKIDFSENVKYLGYVTDNELKALYKNAYCFVYPSIYEGFGLPPIEAMTVGCPVIVSNVSSLPEVCGSAAIYCDPFDEKDIAEKINYLIQNQKVREDYVTKAIAHSKNFSWSDSAAGILDSIIDD